MVPATMHISLGLCITLLAGANLPAAKPIPHAQVPNTHTTNDKLADLPIEFRCDNMTIKSEPNRNVCSGRVVLRRGTMLVCCNNFEGVADARWQWQRFVCTGDVRAFRDLETVWADKAEFFVADNDLVLTGHPVLHRGASLLEGERVTMNIQENYARVLKPRGRMGTNRAAPVGRAPLPMPTGTLPQICPIPPLNNR